jgi:hypothetical protein
VSKLCLSSSLEMRIQGVAVDQSVRRPSFKILSKKLCCTAHKPYCFIARFFSCLGVIQVFFNRSNKSLLGVCHVRRSIFFTQAKGLYMKFRNSQK